jgi:hypothetical protein
MKQLLLASILALLAACPSPSRSILTDQAQSKSTYRYTAVNTKSDQAKAIDAQREQIVTRYQTGDRTAYVVPGSSKTEVPMQSLDKATLVVHVARVSDINGWGTEVNGEVHRRTTLKLEFPKAKLSTAFTFLQKLETAPLEAIAEVWPTSMAEIQSSKPVGWYERGYVVDVDAQLVTGNPFDTETLVTLYRAQKRSGYYRL